MERSRAYYNGLRHVLFHEAKKKVRATKSALFILAREGCDGTGGSSKKNQGEGERWLTEGMRLAC